MLPSMAAYGSRCKRSLLRTEALDHEVDTMRQGSKVLPRDSRTGMTSFIATREAYIEIGPGGAAATMPHLRCLGTQAEAAVASSSDIVSFHDR